MEALVLYYSRSGNTRRVAEAIASVHGWAIEPLVEPISRQGRIGYLRSAAGSLLGSSGHLEPLTHDLGKYDLVVLGGPIWFFGMSVPVRSFLEQHRDQLRDVAFFLTCGGAGEVRAFAQMERALQRSPSGRLVVLERQINQGQHELLARQFVAQLDRQRQPSPPAKLAGVPSEAPLQH
jgi:flavodoxin